MDFLKELLGDELFATVQKKIEEHNADEKNKDNQIKIGNLGRGDYVARGKFLTETEKLNNMIANKDLEIGEANKLITTLKSATKDNESLQGKISDYEKQVSDLQTQLEDVKLKAALKVALMSEKAVDVDYLTYKLKEKGEPLKLDENGHIENWSDKAQALKIQFPSMFESMSSDGLQVLGDNRLPDANTKKSLTRQELLNKPYAERMKIFSETPDVYNAAMHN